MLGVTAFTLLAISTAALAVRLLLSWGASAPLWDLFLLMLWIGSLIRVCSIISENSKGAK